MAAAVVGGRSMLRRRRCPHMQPCTCCSCICRLLDALMLSAPPRPAAHAHTSTIRCAGQPGAEGVAPDTECTLPE